LIKSWSGLDAPGERLLQLEPEVGERAQELDQPEPVAGRAQERRLVVHRRDDARVGDERDHGRQCVIPGTDIVKLKQHLHHDSCMLGIGNLLLFLITLVEN